MTDRSKDWTPADKLRADATDDEITARLYGYVPFSADAKKVAEVAREFAAACVAEVRITFTHWMALEGAGSTGGAPTVTREQIEDLPRYRNSPGFGLEKWMLVSGRSEAVWLRLDDVRALFGDGE